jgi:uncharacterized protein (DUF779 family)
MIVRRRSPLTGEVNDLDLPITAEQYLRWKNGELIQFVFPNLTADQREFLITGVFPGEWKTYLKRHEA